MTIDELADLLKARDCEAVCYFHTDHFEPWSTSIDEASAHAVERMAELARRSSYARRLSLFYSVFIPYRSDKDGLAGRDDSQVPGDGVIFCARSARQEELAREAIRPLVTADGHEMHLHVHHEFWTRNSSHFDHPVSHWVNTSSTPHADHERLDLHFRLAREAIAREIGAPFERWAFIHGNWALNGSDPLICQVTNEMAVIMRHGGFGDFSFPAGRSYCDPKLERPFTCLPIDLMRAYDDRRADPRAIDADTAVMGPDRFFIWNSPIKSVHSSLDYYSAANRALFKNPERVVATWLSKSVCLGKKLYIKTHAHSMKTDYKLTEPDSLIPHCYPDIVAIFDCLSRVCDRAGLELRFHTVNEIVGFLDALDGGLTTIAPDKNTMASKPPAAHTETAPAPTATIDQSQSILPPVTPSTIGLELAALHRTWIAGEGAQFPIDDLYEKKLASASPLEPYELALASEILERYPPSSTRVIEIGTGWGGLSILLARLGYEVFGFEGNARRHAGCRWHFNEQIRLFPILRDRLFLVPLGLFPDALSSDVASTSKINICIATNITNTYTAEHECEIVQAAATFDELIVDLARFGKTRNSQEERNVLFRMLCDISFKPVERLFFKEPYDYWRFRSRAVGPLRSIVFDSTSAMETKTISSSGSASAESRLPPLNLPGLPAFRRRLFTIVGDKQLEDCPVCHSSNIDPLWRIPMTSLEMPISVFGGYFDQIPTLQVPGSLFCFDLCQACESIFLNPVPKHQKDGYRTTDHYIRKMQNAAEWRGYEEVYNIFARWIPTPCAVMLDAACGIGQYLEVARQQSPDRWRRLIGLELSEKYVAHMRTQNLESYAFDIDNDDLGQFVKPGSVDFITFCEAFEHVERPLDALAKLLVTLRPGGRLFFTAQRYGKDVKAAVRPGEPIYIGEKVMNELPGRLGCRILDMTTSGTRYYVVLEK